MYTYNILIAEDETEIADGIEVYLRNQNYNVFKAYDGLAALKIFNEQKIDLVLMDIMMPKLDGMDATLKIRETSTVPIIILSAKSEDMDKVWGLNIGADDYITKPFSPMELLARINSTLRRIKNYAPESFEQKNIITLGGILLNDETKEVLVDDTAIKITPLEYKILYLLMSYPGKVFSIDEIYEKVWNEPAYNSDTVTVHIRRIREKIEINPKEPKYIKVVWGIGYKFEQPKR